MVASFRSNGILFFYPTSFCHERFISVCISSRSGQHNGYFFLLTQRVSTFFSNVIYRFIICTVLNNTCQMEIRLQLNGWFQIIFVQGLLLLFNELIIIFQFNYCPLICQQLVIILCVAHDCFQQIHTAWPSYYFKLSIYTFIL